MSKLAVLGSSRLQLPALLAFALSACHPAHPVSATGGGPAVPDEKRCVVGLGPSRCVLVPRVVHGPSGVDGTPVRSTCDGDRVRGEYYGAVKLSASLGGTDVDVLATVDRSGSRLRILVPSVPVDAGELVAIVDGDRFSADPRIGVASRAYVVGIASGARVAYRGTEDGAWDEDAEACFGSGCALGVERWRAAVSPRPSRDRVDVELTLPIPPGASERAIGFGLALASSGLIVPQVDASPPRDVLSAIGDRRALETLLFGDVRGERLRVLTWNVKRFTPVMHAVERALAPKSFDDAAVADADIGHAIASFDVIGLEEVWRTASARAIVAAANEERANAGEPPLSLVAAGAPVPSSSDVDAGGIFLASRWPVIRSELRRFRACRGEDCLSGKGILWARLDVDGSPLDVFVTHLNADAGACERDGNVDRSLSVLASLAPTPDALTLASMSCEGTTDAGVRAAQAAEVAAFVREIVAGTGRPSLLLGDFNVDGRHLAPADVASGRAGEFVSLLRSLHLGDADGAEIADVVSEWPLAFDWDVDHADLARHAIADWARAPGTFIGADMPEANERYDYVFVEPPLARDGSPDDVPAALFATSYVEPVWSAPWPSGRGGKRLSDHKPVASSLVLVPLAFTAATSRGR